MQTYRKNRRFNFVILISFCALVFGCSGNNADESASEDSKRSSKTDKSNSNEDEIKISKAVLRDADKINEVFSFKAGKVIQLDDNADYQEIEFDFALDVPHGLGMNNQKLRDSFSGTRTIVDLGDIDLEGPLNIPESGFVPALRLEQIIDGHVYVIKKNASEVAGAIKIHKLDLNEELIEFSWRRMK